MTLCRHSMLWAAAIIAVALVSNGQGLSDTGSFAIIGAMVAAALATQSRRSVRSGC